MIKTGEKLRLLRGNMTQEELSKRSSVDKAIISKIERGKMTGTVECYKKIARAFGLKLSELYAYFEEENPRPVEFHPGGRKTDVYQNFLEILSSIPLSKRMLPMMLTLQPAEERHLEETMKPSERFLIILGGEVEITTEGKTYKLVYSEDNEKGDSIYSKSPERHIIKNSGNVVARVLCVSSPPVL